MVGGAREFSKLIQCNCIFTKSSVCFYFTQITNNGCVMLLILLINLYNLVH